MVVLYQGKNSVEKKDESRRDDRYEGFELGMKSDDPLLPTV